MADQKNGVNIDKLDKNFSVATAIGEADVKLYDVREAPFEIYGLYDPVGQTQFKRMPDEIAASVNEGVKNLNFHTSGGRVRFSTDSRYVAISARMPVVPRYSHNSLVGTAAFVLYVDDPLTGESTFHKPFIPGVNMSGGYESKLAFADNRMRYFTICFPSYASVESLYIGLQESASVGGGLKYTDAKPIVYYGSSITQGGCASHAGNIYQNIICRRMNMDYLNFGFSGSCKGEKAIVEYLAGLEMSAFVCDYDHNAPDHEHLRATHLNVYKTVRAAHPDIPFIMLSCPAYYNRFETIYNRREVIHDTYRYACESGDKNVYFIDGATLFSGPYYDMCTVDGVHPTDVGFALMADAIGDVLKKAFVHSYMI